MVTPPSGHLTFELFVSGLQRSLEQTRSSFQDEVFEGQPPPRPVKHSSLQNRANSNPYLNQAHKVVLSNSSCKFP